MEKGVYLVIEKGDPGQDRSVIYLTRQEYRIGRSWQHNQPEIAFSSQFISRQHAVISRLGNEYQITDLRSKHGTEVNGVALSDTPRLLQDGDRITLAKGAVVLSFNNLLTTSSGESGITQEMKLPPAVVEQEWPAAWLVIHLERREILLDGMPLYLSGKDMDLLLLLYQRANQAVDYEEIKCQIWPERAADPNVPIPDVGKDEISALVYRLRKKLGQHGQRIRTIPRYGYMLDL
ncbi:FHA domain-containing protein [Brevibacillus humidisoli]|uniref:FHA domain-containing protein n=1 Tax=Brevibacillus humidisoli TaxID=2895522 RepID=UPI001E34D2C4|nr:FHA domain-containing protein [Brevibacillus humidisoli]UFJ41697.1 FHA domain-containing protein [Brevibacillus humidisoli]